MEQRNGRTHDAMVRGGGAGSRLSVPGHRGHDKQFNINLHNLNRVHLHILCISCRECGQTEWQAAGSMEGGASNWVTKTSLLQLGISTCMRMHRILNRK